jgi:hypothetical protein
MIGFDFVMCYIEMTFIVTDVVYCHNVNRLFRFDVSVVELVNSTSRVNKLSRPSRPSMCSLSFIDHSFFSTFYGIDRYSRRKKE